jgi:hypothetical protein
MKRRCKWMSVVIGIATGLAMTACATAQPGEPTTPDAVLKTLVQIATQEDLADEKRIGSLLGLNIVMIPEPPLEMRDGRIGQGATAKVPENPGYFLTGGSSFYYRHWTLPYRSGLLSMSFDRSKFCMNYKDVLAAFRLHGEVRASAPPTAPHWHPGTALPPLVPKAQQAYAFSFTNDQSKVSLTFNYTECLTSIDIRKPNIVK